MYNTFCGIDFGTTNSAVSVTKLNQNPKLVSFENNKSTIPSAKINNNDIKLLILTGGSTEIPYIKNTILKLFPNAKISEDNKLSSVAMGLSYDARRIYG